MKGIKFENLGLDKVTLIEAPKFADDRGWFSPYFEDKQFQAEHLTWRWVQENRSFSKKGVLRGLHYQRKPFEQAKLVQCTRGAIYDVVVDVRPDSPTRGQWRGVELTAENCKQLFVPTGFAHGFLVLSEEADVFYKVSHYYSPESEGGLRWDDPHVGINWDVYLQGNRPVIHPRDAGWPLLKELNEL